MTPEKYTELVEVYLGSQRHLEALVVAKKAVAAHPTEPALRVLLANVYVCSGKRERATSELRAVLETWSNHAAARQLLEDLPNIFGDS